MNFKQICELKAGDIVSAHGGIFRVMEDARDSQGHRPMGPRQAVLAGPSDCAVATAVCVSGSIPGYFKPGSEWTFQGNFRAPRVELVDGE